MRQAVVSCTKEPGAHLIIGLRDPVLGETQFPDSASSHCGTLGSYLTTVIKTAGFGKKATFAFTKPRWARAVSRAMERECLLARQIYIYFCELGDL